jgi:ABC-type multidrug transport system ATPase subunit
MKVTLKNLGLLKQAEFTLGDLTIICGSNNMGKTYATYALFGFLYFWNELVDLIWNELVDLRLYDIDIDDNKIEEFISNGLVDINLQQIQIDLFEQVINNACNKYTNEFLTKVFASSIDQFKNSLFKIDLDISNYMISSYNRKALYYSNEEDREVRTIEISFSRENNSMIISLSRDVGVQVDSQWLKITINRIVKNAIQHFAFFDLFPKPFIISSERTGAATFRKELDFARNRLLKNIAHGNRDIKTITSMLQQGYQDYPLPVEQNVEFTRNLEKIVKQRSFISHLHPEILTEFSDMIGGDYQVSGEDILSYVPLKNKKLKLSLNESSSAIRSLLDLGFYLRHQAAVGDLLMIDEPELNLHPDNQRRIARLLARLVNLGIKVFITTHSSYIIKELNTLIMLNRDEPHLKQIAAEENYLESELLSPDKVKVYVAKEALVQLDGQKKKTRSPTLVPAKISPELGIELTSFDTAINTINRIQERIVWGSD